MSSFFEAEIHLVSPGHWQLRLESYTIFKTPKHTDEQKPQSNTKQQQKEIGIF